MHILRNEDDLSAVEDPELLQLIHQRINEVQEVVPTFGDLVVYLIVDPADRSEALEAQLGFSVLRNRFDDKPYGLPGFTPSWDVLEDHPGHFELVYVLGDDGSGITLFITKSPDVAEPQLQQMCAQYAVNQHTASAEGDR